MPQRNKDRAFVLFLNGRGWKNTQIAEIINWAEKTVRRSPVSYSYVKKGEQKRLEQTPRRGRRLSILGLWFPLVSFEYGLAIGSFTSETYIKVMDWQAEQARSHLADKLLRS